MNEEELKKWVKNHLCYSCQKECKEEVTNWKTAKIIQCTGYKHD